MRSTLYTFQQLNDALTNCTAFYLTRETTEDGDQAYALRDGCGDQDGDLFEDLYDVQSYITEDQDCFDYLYRFNAA